ncbi:Alpha/Beta hydrolase protein [Hypoxylon rubiginosum]|uniref:Alpha/Beta hydrolase protein n=1 Tax=Hypoxylon rubiginosum TaxID=110542 RepID=A0ACC0DHF6_9PEZI|nr:Alpha/Beta hydrolase protein [Hypoxylon rubiginosum]
MLPQIPFVLSSLPAVLQKPCQDLRIPVSVQKTTNYEFSNENYNAEVLYALAGKEILVSNEYEMSARLCLPESQSNENSHEDTLQILIHGASFNKNMWDIQYKPETYSYVQRMSKEGYPTLAVDLVGNGNSTFPDGLLEAQTQMYVATVHDLIQKLRNGEVGGKSWEKIVLVGFSIGAITANSLAQQYPEDVDAIVLHGISWDLTWIYPAFLSGLQAPAQQIDPDKWGSIPPTYQTQSSREGRLVACFAGSYDPDIVEYDWQTRDFDTLGAAVTFTYHLVEAPEYKGPVFLGIGDQDSTFCGGKVCREQPYALYNRFPKAQAYDIKVYGETGHLILYHNSGPQLMADTLAFLGANGF